MDQYGVASYLNYPSRRYDFTGKAQLPDFLDMVKVAGEVNADINTFYTPDNDPHYDFDFDFTFVVLELYGSLSLVRHNNLGCLPECPGVGVSADSGFEVIPGILQITELRGYVDGLANPITG